MTTAERIKEMEHRLHQAFAPTHLEIIDDSEQHRGHAGSLGGAGHYTVIITADAFAKCSRIETHRLIYHALADLIPKEIHALRIQVRDLNK